jgi:hypothetical protein
MQNGGPFSMGTSQSGTLRKVIAVLQRSRPTVVNFVRRNASRSGVTALSKILGEVI